MDKEYVHSQFGVDGKKLQFKTNSGKLTEVKLKIKFPDKFEFLNAEFTSDNLIKVYFKGLGGCTLEENLVKSTSLKTEKIEVNLGSTNSIPDIIKIEYVLAEVSDDCKPNFVPDTAGGGILVGTGG